MIALQATHTPEGVMIFRRCRLFGRLSPGHAACKLFPSRFIYPNLLLQ